MLTALPYPMSPHGHRTGREKYGFDDESVHDSPANAITGVNLYQIHRFEVVGFRDIFSAATIQGWRLSAGSFCPL